MSFLCVCSTEKLTSELQSRETKCMKLYQRLQRWPECNALAHKLLLKKSVQLPFTPHTHTSHTHTSAEKQAVLMRVFILPVLMTGSSTPPTSTPSSTWWISPGLRQQRATSEYLVYFLPPKDKKLTSEF